VIFKLLYFMTPIIACQSQKDFETIRRKNFSVSTVRQSKLFYESRTNKRSSHRHCFYLYFTPFLEAKRSASSRGGWSKELCLEGSRSSFDREMTGAKAPKTPSLDLSPQWALRNRNKCVSGRLVELSLLVYHFIFFLRKLQLLTPKKLWFLI